LTSIDFSAVEFDDKVLFALDHVSLFDVRIKISRAVPSRIWRT